jgi:hypothetical protein
VLGWVLLLAAGVSGRAEPGIELYTMGWGPSLYERFGHAAVCAVYESDPNRTRCYNYGTTDFDSPPHELGYSVLRGRATFWVSVWRRDAMLESYRRADRSVWRQRLPLTPEQARRLARKLQFDARKENRSYAYHHFRDNCSTRVRDNLDDVLEHSLLRASSEPLELSYRELVRGRLRDQTWLLMASDLLVGRAADRRPTSYEAMFLPAHLRRAVAEQMGAAPELVYARVGPAPAAGRIPRQQWACALGLLLAVPIALGAKLPRFRRASLAVSSCALGLLGLLVWAVAGASRIPELAHNETLLVLLPTDGALALLSDRWQSHYLRFRLAALALVSLGLAIGVLHQPLLLVTLIPGLPLVLLWLGRMDNRRVRH